MKRIKVIGFAVLVLCALVVTSSQAQTLSLGGQWSFRLDSANAGEASRWYSQSLPDKLRLPGSLQEQGFGNDVTAQTNWVARAVRGENSGYPNWYTSPMFEKYRQPGSISYPYWLQPKKHYVGAAWYQRQIDVPSGWVDKRIVLHLERAHWATTVWVDDQRIGANDSLATMHDYDLTDSLRPGTSSKLTIRVDNSMIHDVGIDAHSVSDETQTAWNGIIGKIELIAGSKTWLDDVQVYPDVAAKSARVMVRIGNRGTAGRGRIEAFARLRNSNQVISAQAPVEWTAAGGEASTTIELGPQARFWDEFHPDLYDLTVLLRREDETLDQRGTTFGLREIATRGTHFALNGKPIQLRGTLECCVFPLTGYPPTDVASWRKIMAACKDFGLNHIRFHSWCPPEAAFEAADEAGIYLQPETNAWVMVREALRPFLAAEGARMLKEYGNHPSFALMAFGNEMGVDAPVAKTLLAEWMKDPRRVYTGMCNADSSVVDEYQYYVARTWQNLPTRHLIGWPPTARNDMLYIEPANTAKDWSSAVDLYPKPLVAHETIQRCVYPDLNQRVKYTGSLNAGYLQIARDQLRDRGMLDQVPDFVRESGLWQVEQSKEEIERHLRTKSLAGFQWLQLNDFTGQGAALVGVLDAFWDSKGYVDGTTFRRFCAPVVPLARMNGRVWTSDQTFEAAIELLNYGSDDISNITLDCRIVDASGAELFARTLPVTRSARGELTRIGSIALDLSKIRNASQCRLIVQSPQVGAANDWNFWVYPAAPAQSDPGNVVIATSLTPGLLSRLSNGATVLLLPPLDSVRGPQQPPFVSIYWNCPWTDGGESETLGFMTDPKHPVYSQFPTEAHTDWQWADLLINARAMAIDEHGREYPWPKDYRPLLQPIDDWNQNRKLALLAEAAVGSGKLMICTMDISSNLNKRPAARQFRTSLLAYLNSDAFHPLTRINEQQLRSCFVE
jgi:hypothetical protein